MGLTTANRETQGIQKIPDVHVFVELHSASRELLQRPVRVIGAQLCR